MKIPRSLCALIAAISLALAPPPASCATPPPDAVPAPPAYPSPNIGYWMGIHQSFVARAARGNVPLLFIGDSLTANWLVAGKTVWSQDFEPLGAVNFGIGGDRTQNVLWRIWNGELTGIAPKKIVLLIGANNLGDGAADVTAGVSAVAWALEYIQPHATILLLGLLPAGEPGDALRTRIETVNEALARLDDGKRIRFRNIDAALLNADGTQNTAFFMPDRIHLSAEGYRVFAAQLQGIFDQLDKEQSR